MTRQKKNFKTVSAHQRNTDLILKMIKKGQKISCHSPFKSLVLMARHFFTSGEILVGVQNLRILRCVMFYLFVHVTYPPPTPTLLYEGAAVVHLYVEALPLLPLHEAHDLHIMSHILCCPCGGVRSASAIFFSSAA